MADMQSPLPLVSVVTPVYNGARYLAECLDSVSNQTYPRFEHVILDNASEDGSRAIAEERAVGDPRLHVFANEEKLPVLENWNRALGFISPKSRYVWVLPADDAMMPMSLEKMVGLARRHPSVGIVGSLRRRGAEVQCSGLPTDRSVFPGREVARLFLSEEVFAIAPTGNLIRRDLVEAQRPFYREDYLHGDIAAFLGILDRIDFGFVHEELMFSRPHAASLTATKAERDGTLYRDGLLMLREFGPRYFAPEELAALEARFLARYHRFLVRAAVMLRGRRFFAYHLAALRAAGRLPGALQLARALGQETGAAFSRPGKALRHLRGRLGLGPAL